jgi:transposase-like protein
LDRVFSRRPGPGTARFETRLRARTAIRSRGRAGGLADIFVACIDGLAGFPEAIRAVYPQVSVQLCLVHLVRAALRYVSTADSQLVIAGLKKIYQAATVLEAEQSLETFAQAWDAKYPTIAKQWRTKWTEIIPLFDFPPPIRKAIYTTNAIESVNSVIRKFTRNRKIYPNEESALKDRLYGDPRSRPKMDHADSPLENRPQPFRCLRRTTTQPPSLKFLLR